MVSRRNHCLNDSASSRRRRRVGPYFLFTPHKHSAVAILFCHSSPLSTLFYQMQTFHQHCLANCVQINLFIFQRQRIHPQHKFSVFFRDDSVRLCRSYCYQSTQHNTNNTQKTHTQNHSHNAQHSTTATLSKQNEQHKENDVPARPPGATKEGGK